MGANAQPAGETAPQDLDALRIRTGFEILDPVPSADLDSTLVSEVPVEWARQHVVLPVRHCGRLCVLIGDEAGWKARGFLELLLDAELQPLLSSRDTILSCIEKCYFSRTESASDFLRDLAPSGAPREESRRSEDLLQDADNAPVTQLVNLILLDAVKAGASDVHVEPFQSALRIRRRVDGLLYEHSSPPKHLEAALVSRLKVMARLDIAERRLPQDGVARVRVGEREIDIRVSTIPVAEGERVVLRLLNRESALLPLDKLGLPERALAVLDALIAEPSGILIVAGPTGSGKTTTLYAILQQLDTEHINILTIEDPVEYQIPNIGQIQVKPKIGLTFASGLRHILRQDPDVILVGEVRDIETAEIAIRASLTGHLVFTTLHTNDAPGTLVRLIDIGIEPYLLAASLRAVISQRLVRTLCPRCRVQEELNGDSSEVMDRIRAKLGSRPAWAPRGCQACIEGYRGRTGIFEMMKVGPELAETIRRGETRPAALRDLAIRNGMTTLLDDGIERILEGQTSVQEVLRVIGKSAQA